MRTRLSGLFLDKVIILFTILFQILYLSKKRYTMKKFIFATAIISLTLLASCGEDSPSSAEDTPSSSEAIIPNSSSPEQKSSSSTNESSTLSSSSIGTEPTSSSKTTSSSSAEGVSSTPNPPSNYNPENNTLTDERNGKVYKTTKIGNQVWMAENLNIDISTWETTLKNPNFPEEKLDYSITVRCPKSGTEEDCDKYGRLYSQPGFLLEFSNEEIFDRFPTVPESLRPFQGVCPTGWHIPSFDEWQELFSEEYLSDLLSVKDGGTNKSGFNIQIIGFSTSYEEGDTYETTTGYSDRLTMFATVDEVNITHIIAVNVDKKTVATYSGKKGLHYAVRCLMD